MLAEMFVRNLAITLGVAIVVAGCSGSGGEAEDILEEYYDNDLESFLEDTYAEGFSDALDCVERTGGSAAYAAAYCENK